MDIHNNHCLTTSLLEIIIILLSLLVHNNVTTSANTSLCFYLTIKNIIRTCTKFHSQGSYNTDQVLITLCSQLRLVSDVVIKILNIGIVNITWGLWSNNPVIIEQDNIWTTGEHLNIRTLEHTLHRIGC